MKKRILIIEDEALILFSLTTALKSGSIELTTAETAGKALQELESSPPYDLCIVDLSLPDMNGMDLIKSIKDNYPISNFIIMTGKYQNRQDMVEDRKDVADIESYGFISKPFDFEEAMETIFQALAKEN